METVSLPDLTMIFADFQLTLPSSADQSSENNAKPASTSVPVTGAELPVEYLFVATTVIVGLIVAGVLMTKWRNQKPL
jgi:hypothetical protein